VGRAFGRLGDLDDTSHANQERHCRAGIVGIYQRHDWAKEKTRCTRPMVCAPSRRSGKQAACRKVVAIQPSALRRDVAEEGLSEQRTSGRGAGNSVRRTSYSRTRARSISAARRCHSLPSSQERT
jgi:hypothetical protein